MAGGLQLGSDPSLDSPPRDARPRVCASPETGEPLHPQLDPDFNRQVMAALDAGMRAAETGQRQSMRAYNARGRGMHDEQRTVIERQSGLASPRSDQSAA